VVTDTPNALAVSRLERFLEDEAMMSYLTGELCGREEIKEVRLL
jgi:hypothetical protein